MNFTCHFVGRNMYRTNLNSVHQISSHRRPSSDTHFLKHPPPFLQFVAKMLWSRDRSTILLYETLPREIIATHLIHSFARLYFGDSLHNEVRFKIDIFSNNFHVVCCTTRWNVSQDAAHEDSNETS